MNRHQRRALAKVGGTSLGQAVGQIQQAVTTLQGVKDLETVPSKIDEAYRLMVEAHTTVSALVEDYQALADETEALKAMVFSLAGPEAETVFQGHLDRIRAQRTGKM